MLLKGPWAVANKGLPIRLQASITLPMAENQQVGALQRGDTVFVLSRQEVSPGTWRARIALDAGSGAKGWVTSSKDGAEFLNFDSKQGFQEKFKYHFFSFQVASQTGYLGH